MNAIEGGLYAVVLKLLPHAEATIPTVMGEQVHAAFLTAINEADPTLAAELHDPQQSLRPFTVSPLLGARRIQGNRLRLSPQRGCSLRFTMLYEPIYKRLMERLLRVQDRPSIRLGDAKLLIAEALVTPGSAPWAGNTSWQRLLADAADTRTITLEFASPTAFRRGDLDLPLPLPELVFRSYLNRWQAFSQIPLHISLAAPDFFAHHIGVKEHRIRTVPFHDGRVTIPGFVGKCAFLIKGKLEKEIIKQINCLADFAFYAGTGRKTTHGMGMTRRSE